MSARPASWALIALAAMSLSCGGKKLTQIVVVVDSDYDYFDHVRIEVGGFDKPTQVSADLVSKPLPRRVTLVHDGGPLGPLSVTVSGYVAGFDDPVLVEPRTHLFFVAGQARMLKVNLLFRCIGACAAGEACIDAPTDGPNCGPSDAAAKLEPWSGGATPLGVRYHVMGGDVVGTVTDDAGMTTVVSMSDAAGAEAGSTTGSGSGGTSSPEDGSVSSGRDAAVDAGPTKPAVTYPYGPGNFDPTATAVLALERPDVVIDCASAKFDSTDLSFADFCGVQPKAMVVTQSDGTEAALLVMGSLDVKSGAALQLVGTRPVIFAVFGDARISGTLDVAAHGALAGAGGDSAACGGSAGESGASGSGAGAAGGGSGGGFGSAGAEGGIGYAGGAAVSGGVAAGTGALSPLRGGCGGGRGGVMSNSTSSAASGGAGGGALEIAAAGKLTVEGGIHAGGGGGAVPSDALFGGGGGGSGGALLLEGASVDVAPTAVIAANGGGGGGGQPNSVSGSTSAAGGDGAADVAAAAGGAASGSAGGGGAGAAVVGDAGRGSDGQLSLTSRGAGGGGGGGVGRVAIRGARACVLPGKLSPLPLVTCESCGSCPEVPALGCTLLDHSAKVYVHCSATDSWQAARTSCQSVGLDLVHVHDTDENAWLANNLSAEAWIGASGTGTTSSTWTWVDDGTTFYASGSPVSGTFNAWASNNPQVISNSRCATLNTSAQWHDRTCNSSYPYLCAPP